MVLFCMQHAMSLFQFLWLKCTRYKNEKVVLCAQSNFAGSEFSTRMVEKGVFDKVVSVHNIGITAGSGSYIESVRRYYDSVFDRAGLDIDDFAEIIISMDVRNSFFIYCVLNNRPVSFLEAYKGQFENRERYCLSRKYSNGPLEIEETHLRYDALCGGHPLVTRRYLYSETAGKQVDEKDEYINFVDEFFSLPARSRELILDSFAIRSTGQYQNCSLFIFNSLGYSNPKTGLPLDTGILPYLLIADTYLAKEEKLVVKPHPMSGPPARAAAANNLKGQATMELAIPVEIYALMDGFHINKIISINSTGNGKVARFVDQEIKLGDNTLVYWRDILPLWSTVYILDALKISVDYQFWGFDSKFLASFQASLTGWKAETPVPGETRVSVVKDGDSTAISEDKWICFLSIDAAEKWCRNHDYEVAERIQPVAIQKHPLREKVLCDQENEFLYFFNADEEDRAALQQVNIRKTLPYTGIELVLEPLNEEARQTHFAEAQKNRKIAE